ncbi:type II toxin-antitoxin system RelB/DinJ family antitoxin [Candidatus Nomurabacteria bacterium]|nr:type II toxin-antitoxin system RelB/DinJ family antitoxin [Candidatus Nomurabacteria bacterium]
MNTTTMQIRIDAPTKARAKKAFKDMGLDMSSGVKFLLTQVGNKNGVNYICPFGFMHRYTPEMLESFEKEVQEAIKSKRTFTNAKDLHAQIMKK